MQRNIEGLPQGSWIRPQRVRFAQSGRTKQNEQLSERSLKMHERRKSDSAKDMYILEDVSQRLKITGNLGLS